MIYGRQIGFVLAWAGLWAGCDADRPPKAPSVALRCAELEPIIVEATCAFSTPPAVPDRVTNASVLVDDGPPGWIRRVHGIVPLGNDARLAVGTYGRFFDEGAWWVGFDADGQSSFSDGTPYFADRGVDVALAGSWVWVMLAGYDDTRLVRIDAEGNAASIDLTGIVGGHLVGLPSGELTLFDFAGETIYGIDAEGAIAWSSADDLTPGGHVTVSQGVVTRIDETQAVLWSYDPRRDSMPDGFEGYAGAHTASLHESGGTAVLFTRLGETGDEPWVSRLDPDGEEVWRARLPPSLPSGVRIGGSHTLVIGHAQECDESPAYYVLDAHGDLEHQGTVEDPYVAWWIDADGTAWSAGSLGSEIELRVYEGVAS